MRDQNVTSRILGGTMTRETVLEPLLTNVPTADIGLSEEILWDLKKIEAGLDREKFPREVMGEHFAKFLAHDTNKEFAKMGFICPKPDDAAATIDVTDIARAEGTEPLFLQFANINGDVGKAVQFAKAYGYLGFWYPTQRAYVLTGEDLGANDTQQNRNPSPCLAEPILYWIKQSQKMHSLVKTWENLHASKAKQFEEVADNTKGKLRFEDNVEDRILSSSTQLGKNITLRHQVTKTGRTGSDAYAAGLSNILHQANEVVSETTIYSVGFDPATLQVKPRLALKSLYAFLWYDFARHLCSGAELRLCADCGSYFIVPQSQRRSKISCSNKCRKRKSRSGPQP